MGSKEVASRNFSFSHFELDCSTGELRRGGERLHLQEQPFRILKLLLERSRQVVPREEIRQVLWPDRPFVDADHGINVAVSKLREVLGDSAETPRFIETMSRRGYRFINPVMVDGKIRSLAVLPFANLSGDPEKQYLADGLTMAVIGRLGAISALRVISWQSVVQFNNTRQPLPEIAQLLDVDALVVGGVMRQNGRMRIEVELVATDPESVIWVESFDVTAAELLAVQRELAQTIARKIQAVVSEEEKTRLKREEDVPVAAYDAYLRGLYRWARFSEPELLGAVEEFEQAIDLAPDFAAASAALADTWLMIGWYGYRAPLEVLPRAEAAARLALELAPRSDAAHTSMGGVLSCYRRKFSDAREHYRRAIQLNPSNSLARNWYSWELAYQGRHEEALEQIRAAQRIDPLSVLISGMVGVRLYQARRYKEAIRQLEFALEMYPEMPPALLFLGQAQQQIGNLDNAIAAFEKATAVSDRAPTYEAALASAFAAAGRRTEAEALLSELVARSESDYVSAYQVAVVLIALERFDESFRLLDRALEEASPLIAMAEIDPQLDPIRSDPRFAKLLRQMRTPLED